jgi:hypothetical protein
MKTTKPAKSSATEHCQTDGPSSLLMSTRWLFVGGDPKVNRWSHEGDSYHFYGI